MENGASSGNSAKYLGIALQVNVVSKLVCSLEAPKPKIQATLVISTSVISNNCLSRRENLALVLTKKSNIR